MIITKHANPIRVRPTPGDVVEPELRLLLIVLLLVMVVVVVLVGRHGRRSSRLGRQPVGRHVSVYLAVAGHRGWRRPVEPGRCSRVYDVGAGHILELHVRQALDEVHVLVPHPG